MLEMGLELVSYFTVHLLLFPKYSNAQMWYLSILNSCVLTVYNNQRASKYCGFAFYLERIVGSSTLLWQISKLLTYKALHYHNTRVLNLITIPGLLLWLRKCYCRIIVWVWEAWGKILPTQNTTPNLYAYSSAIWRLKQEDTLIPKVWEPAWVSYQYHQSHK